MPNSNGGIWKGLQNSIANHPTPVAVIMILLVVFLVLIFLRPRVFDRTRGLVTRLGRRTPAPPVEEVDTDDEGSDEDDVMEEDKMKKNPGESTESFRARRRRGFKRSRRVGMRR